MHDPNPRSALQTDLYQLTMAYGYWKSGRARQQAVFQLSYRQAPFGGAYAVAAGLQQAVELLEGFHFEADELAYLGELQGADGAPLFERAFLDELASWRFECDVDAIPEGRLVFPHEPLLRIQGPLAQAQLFETPLLTLLNFQTLIATKATRVVRAAGEAPVLEFGLRRAQGFDGALSATRAAWIGGVAGTSNVHAGRVLDIPVKGTHAHSWVMAFEEEQQAFEQYARALPNNCLLLVDTYDTLEGVRRAVRVGLGLRARGHELLGVRLDSGDLCALSRAARAELDAAGFPEAKVVASNDLDEHAIMRLRAAGAAIDVWGVGTKLITAHDQPALGGVFKLSALEGADGAWRRVVKLSEDPIKVSLPGRVQVRRYSRAGVPCGDLMWELDSPPGAAARALSLDGAHDALGYEDAVGEELLQPLFRAGRLVGERPSLRAARERCAAELARFPAQVLALEEPSEHPVGLDPRLRAQRDALVSAARDPHKKHDSKLEHTS